MSEPNRTEPNKYSILFIASLTLLLLGVVILTACQAPEESAEEAGDETALVGEATAAQQRACNRDAICKGKYNACVKQNCQTRQPRKEAGESAQAYRGRVAQWRQQLSACRNSCFDTVLCTSIVNVCSGNVLTNTTTTSCGSAIMYSYDCSSRRSANAPYRCDPNAPDGVIITPYDSATRTRETRGPGPGCVPS